MSDTLARPGLRLGPRPERTAPRPAWLDRVGGDLEDRLLRRRPGLRQLRDFSNEVAALRESLRGVSDRTLAARTAELRLALWRSRGGRGLAAQSFALVAETARRTLGLDPYDVQVMGGYALLCGMLAEMETGEGKTLTATLPACTAALAGAPVHVITVNDYLVERDARLMAPLYAALGLRVGTARDGDTGPGARRAAYASDVTYVTNKQIGFDYLRDRLAGASRSSRACSELRALLGAESPAGAPILRGLCFAVVDEADSVLVDEAGTPLILSRTAPAGELAELAHLALELSDHLETPLHYHLDARVRAAVLTPPGRELWSSLTQGRSGPWRIGSRREELACQALAARHLFARDRDYLVREGAIQLIDSNTGRVMPDRAWEGGLQQLIEAKEGLAITGQRETLARITYQQLYRRYLRMGGMTGTGREVARELAAVYGLHTIRIPTRLPSRRRDLGKRLFATSEAKWEAIAARAAQLRSAGRPVLIGTQSVASSERLSARLTALAIPHQLLNARQDAREAEVVSHAGGPGRVTVATQMAGRGTDVALGNGVAERGGLHVIVAERAGARRIDRQLVGRCARHGEPGSFERFDCVEDEIVSAELPTRLAGWLERAVRAGRPGAWLARRFIALAQRLAEARSAHGRRALMRAEEALQRALAFAGRSG